MSDWFTVVEVSQKTGIPQQTLRRYIQQHKHLLKMKKEHKAYQLHEECVSILTKIRELYGNGKTQEEVDKILTLSGIPITVDGEVVSDSHEQVSNSDNKALEDIMNALDEQKEFNKQLLNLFKAQAEKMDEQQKYIEDSLKRRDEMLMQSLRESQETKRMLAIAHEREQKEKSWWKRIFK